MQVALAARDRAKWNLDQRRLQAPGPGQIVDSSAHALAAMCRDAGAAPTYLGRVGDELAATTDPSPRTVMARAEPPTSTDPRSVRRSRSNATTWPVV